MGSKVKHSCSVICPSERSELNRLTVGLTDMGCGFVTHVLCSVVISVPFVSAGHMMLSAEADLGALRGER